MIAYIAIFSALLSRLCALACGSTWVTSFIARFLNIHRSGVLTALAWLVPHETAAGSAQVLCTPYNHAPCYFMQSHIREVDACLCHQPPALLAEWPGSFTCYCSNTDTEISVSTESRPWRRLKFSRRSCRDSNPRPFNHESGALTTDLSPPSRCFLTLTNLTSFCFCTVIEVIAEYWTVCRSQLKVFRRSTIVTTVYLIYLKVSVMKCLYYINLK